MVHQLDSIAKFYDCERAFFAMEMRLGKTAACLWWLTGRYIPVEAIPVQEIKRKPPTMCLVAGPLSVLPGWEEEAQREKILTVMLAGHSKERQFEIAESAFECSNPGERMTLFITNWQSLIEIGYQTPNGKPKPVPSPVCLLPWDGAILDESTAIRNPQAQVTRVVRAHLKPRLRACLSGLPNPEGPLDLFEQMLWTYDRFCGVSTYWAARNKYFQHVGYDWCPKRGAGKTIRQAFHRRAFVLSRKEAGLAVDPIYQKIWIDLPPKIREAYDKVERDWEIEGEWTKWMPVIRSWLAGLAGGRPKERKELWSDHKISTLTECLRGDLGFELAKEQVVVWFSRNSELFAAAVALRRAKIKCRTLTGSTKLIDRKRFLRDFKSQRFRVALCQIGVGKFGMDLSVASVAIRFSFTYEYEAHHQSADRTEHPKKKDPTLHISLVVKDTVDEDAVVALAEKGLTAKLYLKKLENSFAARWRKKYG